MAIAARRCRDAAHSGLLLRVAGRAAACLIVGGLAGLMSGAVARVTVQDDTGQLVTLERPAERVVTLAPHLTEMMFAIGAGDRVVGTVEYSDYPAGARRIRRVGDSYRVDIERILELKPDLVLVWTSGNPLRHLEALRRRGIPLFFSEPRALESIPHTMQQLGELTAATGPAREASDRFRSRIETLRHRYAGRQPLTVFYQISDRPLYTLSDRNLVGGLLRLCQAHNIFGHLMPLAPTVSTEAVVAADPDVILGSQPAGRLAFWNRYPGMKAVRRNAVYALDPDLLSRPGPRLAEGAEALCARLDDARRKRPDDDAPIRQDAGRAPPSRP